MKRQRGRNRNNNKNNNSNNPNRSHESNGPDGKVRGNVSTIYEKYTALARDAKTSGNRVKAENLLQHAEHYLRVMNSMEAARQAARAEREAKDAERRAQQGENKSNDAVNDGNEKEEPKPHRQHPARKERDNSNNAGGNDALEVVRPIADSNNQGDAPKRRRKAPARKKTETETVDAAE